MKLLLIGFANQSASVLSVLIERTFDNCICEIIERRISEDYKSHLPIIDINHQDADAMVINLDGVGMANFLPQHAGVLRRFIGVRAAMLVAKNDIILWQGAKILPDPFAICIKSPFSRDDVTDALGYLIKVTPDAAARAEEFMSAEPVVEEEVQVPIADVVITKPKSRASHAFLNNLVDANFNIPQNQLLHELLLVSSAEGTIKLKMGSQHVYIDQAKNLALVNHLDRLLDYCKMVGGMKNPQDVLTVEVVSQEEVDRIASQAPANGYHKHAVSTLLWRLYSEILPSHIEVPDHHLLLKMRYMPNFALMAGISDEMRSFVSSCIVSPRGLLDLSEEDLGDNGKVLFNRVLLLAVLSGVADIDVLRHSFEHGAIAPTKARPVVEKQQNESVQKASQTGFFKRLLGKLKF